MLGAKVSGRKKKRITRVAPDIQSSSQIVHVQPLAEAANPPTRGPSTGAAMANDAQIAII
jgi:hypothetical protein